ncbi:MAG: hypothetical protein WCP12_17495 [bacterium]
MTMNRNVINRSGFLVVVVSAIGLALNSAEAATKNWANADMTWPPGASQEWSIPSNWNLGTAPLAGDIINLARYSAGWIPSVVYLNTATPAFADYITLASNKLYVGSSGVLNSASQIQMGQGTYMYVATGGQVKPTTGFNINALSSTVDSRGTITSADGAANFYINISAGGTLNVLGGAVSTTRSYGSVILGPGVALPVAGTIRQSGGTVTTSVLSLTPGGVYEISGGSVAGTNTSNGLYFNSADATSGGTGGTFRVVGAGATGVTFGGMRYLGAYDRTNATWAFVLDNSAGHISNVVFTALGNSGATLRDGATLSVGLRGGVLLTGTNAFTLIQRVATPTDTGWRVGPGPLWTDTTSSDKTKINIAMNSSANKGTINRGGTVTFTPAASGYVALTNISTAVPLLLQLQLTGGTLANLTNALTAAGIPYQPGSGGYNVRLTLNPVVSGAKYFAWDLSAIDPAMSVQSLQTPPKGTMISIQ